MKYYDTFTKYIIYTISFSVILIVYLINNQNINCNIKEYINFNIYLIPFINCILNTICSILLIISFISIKKKKIIIHVICNTCSLILSIIFLTLYVMYHINGIQTQFPKTNLFYNVYIFILITHIILAAFVIPLVLFSFFYALNKNFIQHKKISLYTLAIWLYVTITGVIIYLMISPYYVL